ncbi:MAG: hypothetical protein V4482_03495 [Pseudomonadota bacterium]
MPHNNITFNFIWLTFLVITCCVSAASDVQYSAEFIGKQDSVRCDLFNKNPMETYLWSEQTENINFVLQDETRVSTASHALPGQ